MEDIEFVQRVKSEMLQIGSENGISDSGDQFAIWFLAKILREKINEAAEVYHIGGAGDHKLDIAIFDDAHSAIVLGQAKYSSNPLQVPPFSADLPEEIKNARDRLVSNPTLGSEKRKAFAELYSERALDKPERLLAIGFGRFSADAVEYATKNKIEIYDFEKIKLRYIYNEVLGEGRPPDTLSFSASANALLSREVKEHKARQWVFLGKAREVHRALQTYQDALFSQNLRYKLEQSAKSGIGAAIVDTVVNDPSALPIFNNGLTIVSSKVDTVTDGLTLHNPQVVNGCQTSWAIYDAFEQMRKRGDDLTINETELLIKLIETNDDALVSRVTQTTNQQNAITPRDIRANDKSQVQIAASFALHQPKVLYESKEGRWEELKRSNGLGPYRISGQQYRNISNIEAAQLYLAILGYPYWSKQNKGRIFNDEHYYKAIFRVDLSVNDRFNDNSLGLSTSHVMLSTGADNFRDDVLFAFGIYQLTDALRTIYSTKLKAYGSPELAPNGQNAAYDTLDGDFQFYKFWHYLLIAGIFYVLRKWVKYWKLDDAALRAEIIGTDWDLLFSSSKKIGQKFNPNFNKDLYLILDEDEPSEEFGAFARWSSALAEKVSELAASERSKSPGKFRYQSFIDQRAETFADLKSWIDSIFAGGKNKALKSFPTDLIKPPQKAR